MKKIAIIGTAGRGNVMTPNQWAWMKETTANWIGVNNHLVSGGAAWADHLAVAMYMEHKCEDLTLHLPAPWDNTNQCFQGPWKSCGSAANFYHEKFSGIVGINSLNEIHQVIHGGAMITEQPALGGYGGMFKRNSIVAQEAEGMIAFTFGEGMVPADGGTLDTWNKCRSEHKIHFQIPNI